MYSKPTYLLFSSLAIFCLVAGCTPTNDDLSATANGTQNNSQSEELTDSKDTASEPKLTVALLELDGPEDSATLLENSLSPASNTPAPETPSIEMFNGSDVFVNSMRKWRDKSGEFSTDAELIEVKMREQRVRLLKSNGVVIEVDYERLSRHDKYFVYEFIQFYRDKDVSTAPKLVEVD